MYTGELKPDTDTLVITLTNEDINKHASDFGLPLGIYEGYTIWLDNPVWVKVDNFIVVPPLDQNLEIWKHEFAHADRVVETRGKTCTERIGYVNWDSGVATCDGSDERLIEGLRNLGLEIIVK